VLLVPVSGAFGAVGVGVNGGGVNGAGAFVGNGKEGGGTTGGGGTGVVVVVVGGGVLPPPPPPPPPLPAKGIVHFVGLPANVPSCGVSAVLLVFVAISQPAAVKVAISFSSAVVFPVTELATSGVPPNPVRLALTVLS
jgi:hypothetical protein